MDQARWHKLDDNIKNHTTQVTILNEQIIEMKKEMLTIRCGDASEVLKGLREAKGLSGRAFAEKISVTRSRYQRIEEDRADMYLHELIEIAEFYQVSTDFLLGLSK